MNSHKKLGRVHVSGEINLSEEKKKKTNESLDKFMSIEFLLRMEMRGRMENMESKKKKDLNAPRWLVISEWVASECEKWKDLYPSLKFEARQKNNKSIRRNV